MADTSEHTPRLDLPLPHPGNTLAADVVRLRAALNLIDEALDLLATGSAAKNHSHAISAITGLAEALDGKAKQADALPARSEDNKGKALVSDGIHALWKEPVWPTAGLGNSTFNRTGGRITSISSSVNGKTVTTTLTRVNGRLNSITTTHDGATRTVTLTRNASEKVSGYTVS